MLHGYGVTVHRLEGEADYDFENRASCEIRKAQPTGIMLLSGEY